MELMSSTFDVSHSSREAYTIERVYTVTSKSERRNIVG